MPRLRDPSWLKHVRKQTCWNCGTLGCDAAHIRWGQEGGMGLKPPDDLVVPLCRHCHMDQESHPGPEWWAKMVKNLARMSYNRWSNQ
jgi:hypothetical protein